MWKRRRVSIAFMTVIFGFVFAAAYSSSDTYTNRNARIVARTSTVFSTISGQINGPSLVSGSLVKKGDRLATVVNARISREALSKLENELTTLKTNIESLSKKVKKVKEKEAFYSAKHTEWLAWLIEDVQFQKQRLEYEIASEEMRYDYLASQADRASLLRKDSVIPESEVLDARHDRNMALTDVNTKKIEYARISEQLKDLKAGLPVFDTDGDVSYWYRLADENKLLAEELSAQIVQDQGRLLFVESRMAEELALYEAQRQENHKAKHDGVVNTVFARTGDLVTANTPILEMLDCNQLTVIAPVAASRQSFFFPGQKVLIQAHNSNDTYSGKVKLISTGTLIGRDKTLPTDNSLLQGHSLL